MVHALRLVLTSLAAAGATLGASQTPAPTYDSGVTVAEVRSSALDAVARAALAQGYPGVTIAWGALDGVVRTGAAGLAHRADDIAMTPASQLHGASTTKVFTAAAILMLVDRGELALDARLGTLLSEELLDGIPHASRISVRELLTHESGLFSPGTKPALVMRRLAPGAEDLPYWTPEEIVRLAADPAHPPSCEPGACRAYSGINYVLLELVAGAVTGAPLKAFVKEELLGPLALTGTYYLSDDRGRERARGYTVDTRRLRQLGLSETFVPDAAGFLDTTGVQDESDGATGLITTMVDLVRFARALIDSELLAPPSRELLLEVLTRAAGRAGSLELGILRARETPYGLVALVLGNGPGTHVVWAYRPSTRSIVAVGINQFGAWNEAGYILQILVPAALAAGDAARSAATDRR